MSSTLYALAIGGSGSRCLEALIHLCALGAGPKNLVPVIIDPDIDGGNLQRLQTTISAYHRVAKLNQGNPGKLFVTNIAEPLKIDPTSLLRNANGNNLRAFFEYDRLSSDAERAAIDLLYSSTMLEQDLSEGFRAVPAMGAPVMQQATSLSQFSQLTHLLKQSPGATVFVMAGVFGGTGASGYPVLVNHLKQLSQSMQLNLKVGGAMLLPYFRLKLPTPGLEGILPDSASFLPNTQAALNYLYKGLQSDANYVLGDTADNPQPDYHPGSKKQENPAHFIELTAALAALDFYAKDITELNRFNVLNVSSPNQNSSWAIQLNDLPFPGNLAHLWRRFGVFRQYWHHLLHLIDNKNKAVLNSLAWLRQCKLSYTALAADKANLDTTTTYLQLFSTWVEQMHLANAPLNIYSPGWINKDLLTADPASMWSNFEVWQLDSLLMDTKASSAPPAATVANLLAIAADKYCSGLE